MRLEREELNHIADRIAERLAEERDSTSLSADGTIKGIDPHRLYTAAQVADRWSVSEKTVRRNLQRADWNGQGARFRGVDILRYEGVDVNTPSPSSSSGGPDPDGPTRHGGDGRTYDSTLPEL